MKELEKTYLKEEIIRKVKGGYCEESKLDNYQISLLVLTYNPDYRKLLATIKSGLIQENVELQIVVADDGSEYFDPIQIVEFFEQNDFHSYVITSLKSNGGTVKNLVNGLQYCKGEYTKLISPGDLLNGSDCLNSWIECIKMNNAVVSFSDCIHYYFEGETVKTVRVKADPQCVKNYYKNTWAYDYIVFDDVVTGACTLAKTDAMIKYCNYIDGKVIFTEDNIYRLMAYKDETACYFSRDAVLYEHGIGISTSGNEKWLKRIFDDYVAADSIMLSWKNDSYVAKQYRRIANIRIEKRFLLRKIKVLFFIFSSGKYKYLWNRRFNPRFTNDKINSDYVMRVFSLTC